MTKKLSLILVMLLCMNCIFSAASAFDSGWGHYKGPAAGKPTEEPVVDIPVEVPVTQPVIEETDDEGTIADGLRSTGTEIQPQSPPALLRLRGG